MKFLRKIYKAHIKNHLPRSLRKCISLFMDIFRKKEFATKQMEKALENWNEVWNSSMFPYPWANEYRTKNFSCGKDENCDLFFVEDKEKKFYLSKNCTEKERALCFAFSAALEQDLLSSHRYVTKENKMWGTLERSEDEILEEVPFFVEKGDIVADIGGSNGNFSISVIENAKHIYLFEADEIWNEPLNKTFEKYKDKITIVNKYVSDVDSEKSVTLDTFFKNKEVNFIKIDIDGYERKLLDGAKNILQREKIKFSICTYHQPQDARDFKQFFRGLGYKTYFTDSYMFFPFIQADCQVFPLKNSQPSYFRKAVLRATK